MLDYNWMTIVVYDPLVSHDRDPRSYLKGQGHSAFLKNIHVCAITPHCHVESG